jgi:biotin carboxyl carrier protein
MLFSVFNGPCSSGRLAVSQVLFLLFLATACSSKHEVKSRSTVVNAPADGEVRRILISEGLKVQAGTPIIEILLLADKTSVSAPSPDETAERLAARNLEGLSAEVEVARAAVVRHEAEIHRLTPLVASGEASAATLDGERALYERAQQRLEKAKEAERAAQTSLSAGQRGKQAATPTPREQIVTIQAPTVGTVRTISAQVGHQVTRGQPLATISSDEP